MQWKNSPEFLTDALSVLKGYLISAYLLSGICPIIHLAMKLQI